MPEYKFVFTQTSEDGASGLTQPLSSNGLPQKETKEMQSVMQAFGNKIVTQAEQAIIAPLNSATGGLAQPLYTVGKAVIAGAGAGSIAGGIVGVVIAGVKLLVEQIQSRVAQLENQAMQANEHDNALVRAGAVSRANYYERNGLSGIKAKQR